MPVEPQLSVVVPTRGRPVRLRWLLNALEEQTLPAEGWEVLVAHDADDRATAAVLEDHPLAREGALRAVPCEPAQRNGGPGPPTSAAMKRNAAWRAARAPVVVFTDDDCRPPEGWLEGVRHAVREHPGAVVQGPTQPDPDEFDPHHAPLFTTQFIDAPTKWGQTCNIAYPREVLERAGGFDESFTRVGEDTDLLQRAIGQGVAHVGAPEALTYHCVEARSLRAYLRRCWNWQEVPLLVARHPQMREGQPLGGLFWKPTHAGVLLALAGLGGAAASRRPWLLALLVPWARATFPYHGRHARGRARSTVELPRRFVVDLVETAALVRGSIRHRTFFL